MSVSAQDVKTLREKTGAGIMDCKQALSESNGDLERAIRILREKGLAEAKKRAGREAKEGIITVVYSEDRNTVCMIEANCETDFVSRTDKYRDFVQNLALTVLDRGVETTQAIPEEVNHMLKEAIGTFGENVLLRKIARMNKTDADKSIFYHYIHLDGKVGVIVEFMLDDGGKKENEDFLEFAKNIALQVASMGPLSVSRDDFPKELLEEQKEIFNKQAKESGKPDNIIEKIVKGRMEKFFAEASLLGQKYVKDNNLTCSKYLAETERKAGVKIEVKRFVRFKLGEE